jgi:predicted nucleotidyltransferase
MSDRGLLPPPATTQSMLRHPLSTILGSEGYVRILRELLRHGGELSATDLAARAGLSPQHARLILKHLVDTGVVDGLGTGRARLYRVRGVHPLAGPLNALFAAEDERFEAVLATVRREAGSLRPRPLAVWLYGSVARGTDTPASDVDLAVIAEASRLEETVEALRERLGPLGDTLSVTFSVVGGEPRDALEAAESEPFWAGVVKDAIPILGPAPDRLAAEVRRQADRTLARAEA